MRLELNASFDVCLEFFEYDKLYSCREMVLVRYQKQSDGRLCIYFRTTVEEEPASLIELKAISKEPMFLSEEISLVLSCVLSFELVEAKLISDRVGSLAKTILEDVNDQSSFKSKNEIIIELKPIKVDYEIEV